MADAAQTACAGLTLIHHGVKKLREARLGVLADRIEAVIADAVQKAEGEVQAAQEADAATAPV